MFGSLSLTRLAPPDLGATWGSEPRRPNSSRATRDHLPFCANDDDMRRAASSAARRALLKRSVHSGARTHNPLVQITTLPNNVRVATEASPGHFAGVGLFVDAGSRYETPSNSGVSHFLDRMAFKVWSLIGVYVFVRFSTISTFIRAEHSRSFRH